MPNKIKIAYVIESSGGTTRHVYDLIENLDTEKYEMYLLYNDKRADGIFFSEKPIVEKKADMIKVSTMKRSIGFSNVISAIKISKIFKSIKPDIVHCHSSIAGICGRLAAKMTGIKTILYTPHAYAFENEKIIGIKKILYINVERLLSRYCTSLTLNVSEGEMSCAVKNKIDKLGKFKVIYNGIPQIEIPAKERLKLRLGLNDTATKYVGTIARCDSQKDPFSFLEIARMVIKQNDNIEFIYVGEGKLFNRMEAWIKSRGLDSKIHLFGFRTDAGSIIGAFDIYLSTAIYEGLPYSLIEAMRAGVPIIATDVIGNAELVVEGKNGHLYTQGDKEKACEMIIDELGNNVITREMVWDTFKKEYSLESMLRKIDNIYMKMMEVS